MLNKTPGRHGDVPQNWEISSGTGRVGKSHTPWTQNVYWKYKGRSEDVHEVLRTSLACSVYVEFPRVMFSLFGGFQTRFLGSIVQAKIKWVLNIIHDGFRSSRSQMFFKIGVLEDLTIFTGKHLCWSLFLIRCRFAA